MLGCLALKDTALDVPISMVSKAPLNVCLLGNTLQQPHNSHFFISMPDGALPSIFLVPTSFQFVDNTVPLDSTYNMSIKPASKAI
jgi:presenilin-like A22 family membrane protease